ncbi:hypothetical protein ACFSC3_05660 [Sphingomonas floccifaciens]|uniref:Uncharacterized protein n=1 Tax=Sphingomonas floccifaciens TaxID=1844115 RepID=A0ABW4NAH4_9SPHN
MSLPAALLLVVIGIVLVRAGWGGRRGLAWVGWAIIAIATTILMMRDGAWGAAIAATAMMIAALVVLAREGLRTAPTRSVPPRAPASVTLPQRALGVGRRLLVFVLVVPIGAGAAYLFAMGAEGAAARLGWQPADRTALAFFVAPIAWTILASIQMIQPGPARMILPPVVCALAGLLLWWPL